MKKEDQASCRLVAAGKIGKPVFIRYSLSVRKNRKLTAESLVCEVFTWIKELECQAPNRLFATYSANKEVLLISMSFNSGTLANLFINGSSIQKRYEKKFEIAGAEGLYVYDSVNNQGFSSSCCEEIDYQIEKGTEEVGAWWQLVAKSISEQRVVYMNEVSL